MTTCATIYRNNFSILLADNLRKLTLYFAADGPFVEVTFFEKNDNSITEVKLCPNHGCPCKNDFQIKVVSTPERDGHSSPGKTTGRDPPSPTNLQHSTSFLHIALQLNCTVRCFGKKKGTDYALLVGINLYQPERVCLMTEAIALLSSSQSSRLTLDSAHTSPNNKTERGRTGHRSFSNGFTTLILLCR